MRIFISIFIFVCAAWGDWASQWEAAIDSKNDKLAFEVASRAYEAGDMGAAVILGTMHADAVGTAQDHKKAFALYSEACQAKNAVGCYQAGVYHTQGLGGAKRDFKMAASLHETACDAGFKRACVNAGFLYLEHIKDYPKAFEYSYKSCEQMNDANGCYNLASFYIRAYGSKKLGAQYFKKSCDLGSQQGCNAYKITAQN